MATPASTGREHVAKAICQSAASYARNLQAPHLVSRTTCRHRADHVDRESKHVCPVCCHSSRSNCSIVRSSYCELSWGVNIFLLLGFGGSAMIPHSATCNSRSRDGCRNANLYPPGYPPDASRAEGAGSAWVSGGVTGRLACIGSSAAR